MTLDPDSLKNVSACCVLLLKLAHSTVLILDT